MDLVELRDLLDYLENLGVDEAARGQVFQRFYPQPIEPTDAPEHSPEPGEDSGSLPSGLTMVTSRRHPK